MIRNIVTTYGARFASLLATLLLLPVVSTSVGAEQYGYYALAASLGLLFQQDLGLGAATTRFVASAWHRKDLPSLRALLASSTVLYSCVAVVASVITAASISVALDPFRGTTLRPEDALYLALLGSITVGGALFLGAQRQAMAGLGLLDIANVVTGLQALLRIASTLVVLFCGGNIVAVAAIDSGSVFVGGLSLYLIRRRCRPSSRFSLREATRSSLRELLSLSLDLLWLSLASAVILQAGTIMAGVLVGAVAAASYTAAQRGLSVVKELTNSLTSAILPTASAMSEAGERGRLTQTYLRGTRWTNMLMVLVVVPLIVNAPLLMQSWVGPGLQASIGAIQILLLAQLLNNNHLLAVPVLTAVGRIRPFVWLHLTWATTGIMLASLLSPLLGTAGIALGFSAPLIVLEPLYVACTLRALGITWRTFSWTCIIVPVVPPLALGLCWWMLMPTLTTGWLAALVASLAWVLLVAVWYWFGVFFRGERRSLQTGINHIFGLNKKGSPSVSLRSRD